MARFGKGFLVSGLVALAVVVGACGQPAANNNPSGQTQPSQPSASQTTPAASQPPVKVGVLLSLSGPAGPVAEKQRIGVEIAAEEINAAGGILGRKIELVVRDDGGDPTKSRTAAEELVEKEKVAFIIGPTLSSPALAIHPYFTERKIVNLGSPAASAATDPTKFPYAFSTSPSDAFILNTIITYAMDTLRLKNIAVLSESAGFGKGALAAAQEIFTQKKVTPVAVEEYKVGDLDFTTHLKKVRAAGADGLIINAGNSTDLVRFMKNLQSLGWDVPVFSNSNLADSAVLVGVGPDGLQKAYSQNHRPLTHSDSSPLSQKTVDFREKVRVKLGGPKPLKTSIQLTAAMYDALHVIKNAAVKAGSFEADKLKAALETMPVYSGVYATWEFSPTKHMPLGDDDGTMVISATCEDAVCKKAPNAQ